LEQDLAPFRALNSAAMGMTGHVVYDVWDNAHTATMSRFVIDAVIRGQVGFDGLLMSDDLDMNALQGDVASRALACVQAGCDLALNCWGRLDEMIAIAANLPEITPAARARLDRAMALPPVPFDADRLAHLLDKRDQLLALADTQAKLTGGATGAA
jgi:beta-N-acetylhexosaminidase